MWKRAKFSVIVVVLQVALLILFGIFVEYSELGLPVAPSAERVERPEHGGGDNATTGLLAAIVDDGTSKDLVGDKKPHDGKIKTRQQSDEGVENDHGIESKAEVLQFYASKL